MIAAFLVVGCSAALGYLVARRGYRQFPEDAAVCAILSAGVSLPFAAVVWQLS